MNNQNELKHYGVVGMKWGVRRGNKKKTRITNARNAFDKQQELQEVRLKRDRKAGVNSTKMDKEERQAWKEYKRNTGVGGKVSDPRKHYSKAFAKSSYKADKLRQKSVKTNLKSAKLQKKALNKEAKATNEDQYKKARKMQFKANKLQLKSAKLQKKAMKWEKSMEKAFEGVTIKDVGPEAAEYGKKYTYMLLQDQSFDYRIFDEFNRR